MRLTERDRLVLTQVLALLPWFGMLLWSLSYSYWLGGAFSLYVTLDRLYFSRYWGPHAYSGDNL